MIEEEIEKGFYISTPRLILIAIALVIIFLSIMVLLYLKADEVTKHPCEVCARKIGSKVTCTAEGSYAQKAFGLVDLSYLNKTFVEDHCKICANELGAELLCYTNETPQRFLSKKFGVIQTLNVSDEKLETIFNVDVEE